MRSGYGGMRSGYRGGGGYNSTVEKGYCAMHNRLRSKADLIPWDERAQAQRCKPSRECRRDEMVFCSIHRRRRAAHQMVEEQPGVWRCKREHPCRTRNMNTNDEGRSHGHGNGQDWFASRTDPSVREPQDSARPQRGNQREDRGGGHLATRQVRCARHGKLLNAYMCEEVQDCCFVCKDSSICLATPLDTPSYLLQHDCPELLCARHQTIRSTGFLELSAEKQEYQCLREHRCRYTTLTGRVPGTTETAVLQQPDQIEEEGGYFDSGVGSGFGDTAQASGREAVSSFFV